MRYWVLILYPRWCCEVRGAYVYYLNFIFEEYSMWFHRTVDFLAIEPYLSESAGA
jgi:hypothetical protein